MLDSDDSDVEIVVCPSAKSTTASSASACPVPACKKPENPQLALPRTSRRNRKARRLLDEKEFRRVHSTPVSGSSQLTGSTVLKTVPAAGSTVPLQNSSLRNHKHSTDHCYSISADGFSPRTDSEPPTTPCFAGNLAVSATSTDPSSTALCAQSETATVVSSRTVPQLVGSPDTLCSPTAQTCSTLSENDNIEATSVHGQQREDRELVRNPGAMGTLENTKPDVCETAVQSDCLVDSSTPDFEPDIKPDVGAPNFEPYFTAAQCLYHQFPDPSVPDVKPSQLAIDDHPDVKPSHFALVDNPDVKPDVSCESGCCDHYHAEASGPNVKPNLSHEPTVVRGSDTKSGKPTLSATSHLKPVSVPPGRRPRHAVKAGPVKQHSRGVRSSTVDEDDFFNLSAHNPVQFFSNTLGLSKQTPTMRISAPSSCLPISRSLSPGMAIHLSDENSEDDPHDEEDKAQPYSKQRHKSSKIHELPSWTKHPNLQLKQVTESDSLDREGCKPVIPDLSSSEESEPLQQTSRKAGALVATKTSGSRPKSRSPTPPPPISPQRTAPNYALHPKVAQPSQPDSDHNPWEGDSQFKRFQTGSLSPAVMALQQAAQANLPNRGVLSSLAPCSGSSLLSGPSITLTVSVILDPRLDWNPSSTNSPNSPKTLMFKLHAKSSFGEIYDAVAQSMNLPSHSVILVHHNVKLSRFVTPESLKILSDTNLKAYEAQVWQYVQTVQRMPSSLLDYPQRSTLEEKPTPEPMFSSPSKRAREEGPVVSTLKLTLRDNQKRELELVVKPTTSFLAIAKQYLKELSDKPLGPAELKCKAERCRIMFDGEQISLSAKVGDTEVDNDDMLEIHA